MFLFAKKLLATMKLAKAGARHLFATPARILGTILVSSFVLLCMFLLSFLLINVHVSKLYVKYQAMLYPANITISPKCIWDRGDAYDFKDYKPDVFVVIAKMLRIAYKRYGIIPIVRDGSFLHTFRRIQADRDFDVFLIVPKELTLREAYVKIGNVIRSYKEFSNMTMETYNPYLAGFILNKCDCPRICVNGIRTVDVNVLHETFLNDPALQAPCINKMNCKPFSEIDNPYIQEHKQEISTKNMFENLCECVYMDVTLVCFNENGARYLEAKYGRNYMLKIPGPYWYELVYERPYRIWTYIFHRYPHIMAYRFYFQWTPN